MANILPLRSKMPRSIVRLLGGCWGRVNFFASLAKSPAARLASTQAVWLGEFIQRTRIFILPHE